MSIAPTPPVIPQFKSVLPLSRWLIAVFVLQAILSSIVTLSNTTATNLAAAADLSAAEAATLLGIFGLVLLQFTAYVAAGVIFLVWIYRSYYNLPVLGAANPRFTPGWAVGWFFIPIMSLFRPYQVVADISRASEPHFDAQGISTARHSSSLWLVVLWWFFFLVYNYVSFATAFSDSSSLTMVLYFIEIAGITITITMVWQLSHNQHLKVTGMPRSN
jgi:hypothetical protein